MTRPTTELAHLFRALKAPAAAWALPKLADRARDEEWTFEKFAAALLKTEVDSRDSHDWPFRPACGATSSCPSASSTSSRAKRNDGLPQHDEYPWSWEMPAPPSCFRRSTEPAPEPSTSIGGEMLLRRFPARLVTPPAAG